MVVLALGSTDSESDPDSHSASSKKIDAWIMAQRFVERNLKAPSTASYGGILDG